MRHRPYLGLAALPLVAARTCRVAQLALGDPRRDHRQVKQGPAMEDHSMATFGGCHCHRLDGVVFKSSTEMHAHSCQQTSSWESAQNPESPGHT